ncbi:MAG: hypothetical protein OXT70_01470 [Chloroflexota bacterium]|nr:hypothetical protein [Chloroflexota bacterium]
MPDAHGLEGSGWRIWQVAAIAAPANEFFSIADRTRVFVTDADGAIDAGRRRFVFVIIFVADAYDRPRRPYTAEIVEASIGRTEWTGRQ